MGESGLVARRRYKFRALGHATASRRPSDFGFVLVPAGFLAEGDAKVKDVPVLRLVDTPAINATELPKGSNTAGTVKVAVCGAHLSGLPLYWELTQRGARLLGAVQSAPEYKFNALAGGLVQRPGMVRVTEGCAAIDMEVWELPAEHFGSFVDGIPAPLGIGKVKLADGIWVSGFVCEAVGVEGGTEITQLCSWRAWFEKKD